MDTTRIGQRGGVAGPDLAEDLAHHLEARLVVQELVYPRIYSTDLNVLRLLAEWH
jgi:hypothetical protein